MKRIHNKLLISKVIELRKKQQKKNKIIDCLSINHSLYSLASSQLALNSSSNRNEFNLYAANKKQNKNKRVH